MNTNSIQVCLWWCGLSRRSTEMLSCARLQAARPQVNTLFQRCLALAPGQRPVPFTHPSSHRVPAGSVHRDPCLQSAGISEPYSASRLPVTTLSSGSPGAWEQCLRPVSHPHTSQAGGRNEPRARTPAPQELWEFVGIPGFSESWDESLG